MTALEPTRQAGGTVADDGPPVEQATGRCVSRSVTSNTAALFSSQMVTFALGAVVMVVLPRRLGAEAVGQLRIASSLWALAAIAISFGIPTLLTKEVARDPRGGGLLVGPALRAQVGLFALTVMAMSGYVALVGYPPEVVAVIAMAGVGAVFSEIAATGRSVLFGVERMELSAVGDVTAKCGYVALLLVVLHLGGGAVSAAGAATASAVLGCCIVLLLARRAAGCRLLASEWGAVRGVLRQGRPYMAMSAIMVVYQQLDVVVISLLIDEETIGWYATSDALLGSLLFIPVILTGVLFPRLSRLHHEDPSSMPAVLRRCLAHLLMVGVPMGVGTTVIASNLVVQVFGQQFHRSGPVLRVVGVVLILMYVTIALGRYSVAVDRQGLWIRSMVGVTVLSIPLDFVLIGFTHERFDNGAIGGAAAYVITEGILVVVGLWKLAPGLVDRHLALRAGKCATAAAVMAVAIWPLRDAFVAVPVGLGGVVYATMVVLLRYFDGDDLQALRPILTKASALLPARTHR